MFKRLAVYMNRYEDGRKTGSCGSAKLLIHNGECRMSLQLKDIQNTGKKARVFFYREEEGTYQTYPAGEMSIHNEQADFQTIFSCADLVEGISFDEMKGILVDCGESERNCICGTFRGEDEIMEKFGQNKKEEKVTEKVIEEIKNEDLSTQNLSFPQENVEKTEKIEKIENSENSVYEYDEECLKSRNGAGKLPVCWQDKIFRVFPKIMLYVDGLETKGIKLKPQDVVWFPGSYWNLAANRFLLKEYAQFHYLLFFSMAGDTEEERRYYLGLPGYFSINEAVTAKQYGFSDFFSASQQKESIPENQAGQKFGFWSMNCR